ncbi:MAG: hypothetical protein AAGD11_08745 [Planctomycetota bacterium]
MEYIEMTGKQLVAVMEQDELNAFQLQSSGVEDDTIVRVNRQGDLEIRQPDGWDVVGGLIGDFDERVSVATGLNWAHPLGG